MEKLVLIDGNAIIHRAYHALPKTMTTRKGEQTNAVYGFTTTLIKVLEDLKPEYFAVSFDLAGKTFRHEKYAEYKATRVKADQELYDQIPRVRQVVEAMNIPIYEMKGFEADDVLGTIVAQMSKSKLQITNKIQITNYKESNQASEASQANNLEIYIVSGDKDIYQLIDGNVFVYSLRKGLSQMQVVDRAIIEKEFNLQPEDFIDLKALAGDASDNIPGVPGIGPKTATTLLQDFDSLKGLYDKIGDVAKPFEQNFQFSIFNFQSIPNDSIFKQISEKLKIKERLLKLLIEHKDQAFLSQHLATIHRDVPIDFSLEEARFGEYDRNKLKELFEELGFVSLLRRFGVVDEKSGRKPTEEQKKKDSQLKLL